MLPPEMTMLSLPEEDGRYSSHTEWQRLLISVPSSLPVVQISFD